MNGWRRVSKMTEKEFDLIQSVCPDRMDYWIMGAGLPPYCDCLGGVTDCNIKNCQKALDFMNIECYNGFYRKV